MPYYPIDQLLDKMITQEFQDAFSEFTGIASVITDSSGKQVTHSSNFSRICRKVLRQSAENISKCMSRSAEASKKSNVTDKPGIYKCHAGLYEISCPILLEDIIIGNFICGQIICTDEGEEYIKEMLLEMNFTQEHISEFLSNIKRMTMAEIQKVADYAFKISKVLSNIAHKNYILIKSNRLRLSKAYVEAEEINLDFGSDVIYNTHELTSSILAGIKTICGQQNVPLDTKVLSVVPDELLGNPKTIQFVIEGIISFIVKHSDIKNILIMFSCTEEYYLYSLSMEIIAETASSCSELSEFMNNCFSENSESENTCSSRIREEIYNNLNANIDFGVTSDNKFRARMTIPQLDVRGKNDE